MTDIKKLLADASPRPWQENWRRLFDANDKAIARSYSEKEFHSSLTPAIDTNLALAAYAVNRLERYEALIPLLKAARCPNCEGDGFTVEPEIKGYDEYGYPDVIGVQVQCQWCYERDAAIAALENDDD